jgi:hypothetical protein
MLQAEQAVNRFEMEPDVACGRLRRIPELVGQEHFKKQ